MYLVRILLGSMGFNLYEQIVLDLLSWGIYTMETQEIHCWTSIWHHHIFLKACCLVSFICFFEIFWSLVNLNIVSNFRRYPQKMLIFVEKIRMLSQPTSCVTCAFLGKMMAVRKLQRSFPAKYAIGCTTQVAWKLGLHTEVSILLSCMFF